MRFIVAKNTRKVVLSSRSKIYKTEAFAVDHSRFLGLDKFITQFAEGMLERGDIFEYARKNDIPTAKLTTTDGNHCLYVRFGFSLHSGLTEDLDLIFYALEDNAQIKRKNDSTLSDYLENKDTLEFAVDLNGSVASNNDLLDRDFKKLYVLFNSDQVNFPLLNVDQQKIVEIENDNVLVQGVAGSGKTNICIDKIIYTACKDYSGKTLYTTFSRGLLVDTIQKVNVFKTNVKDFIDAYLENRVIFTDSNRQKAVENKLGLFVNVSVENIVDELERILSYIDNKVDFYLISDLYGKKDFVFANESFFVKEFGKLLSTRLSGKFAKVSHLSTEVVYKEIYGMIMGSASERDYSPLSLEEYIEKRRDSFSPSVCETIYSLSRDYEKYLAQNNALDNNVISRRLVADATIDYSLTIIDEVQDFTEINLCLLKKISRRLFAVGDALQMINPSFFSFAYLKRLLYEENTIAVSTLNHNYRNTEKITDAINKLSELNVGKFGSHNFVIKGQSVEQGNKTVTVYFPSNNLASLVQKEKLDNFTIVVSSIDQKDILRKILKKQEILTVSEIKGLERDTVLLYNVLSDNADKWSALERTRIDRKKADENSVYRYYFNLLYVGVSRAKHNLFVVENKKIDTFREFFDDYFENLNEKDGFKKLSEIVSKIEIDNDELLTRVDEFLRFGQIDNARFTANKLEDDVLRRKTLTRISINENYVQKGDYRGAGIALWGAGILDEAKKTFEISGDKQLIDLIDVCEGLGETKLNTDIVRFYPELSDNPLAKQIITDALQNESSDLKKDFTNLKRIFNSSKEKKNGKK